ncbi:hypothetical protein M3Y94_00378400 [Aphelenchoides besseyi]|nr:hypothetical protein M3Y94_00378400 [Aphelenchoides besseyi]KAI6235110.1 hypothetical protein M3Y95_00016400 [Aphelenchoides besseyi]
MAPRRLCFPNCKAPEKRDFMEINPEKSAEDFYRNYEPSVGIGTVAILFTIILLASIKSIIRIVHRKYKLWTYDRKLKQLRVNRQTESKETVTFVKDEDKNGMI